MSNNENQSNPGDQSEQRFTLSLAMRTQTKIWKLLEARETARDPVATDFSFASDWMREWHEFSEPIPEQVK